MKIGFITTYFYPLVGGAENNCYYLAKELAKNHEVHVFTSTKGKLPKEEIVHNIHIHRSKTLFRVGYYGAFYPSLLPTLLSYDLDLLHVHSYGFLWHDLCIFIKKIDSNVKLVTTPHGPFMALHTYPLWKRIFKSIIKTLEHPFNNIYNLVLQVNPHQITWMTRAGFKEENIVFLPNGIPSDFFSQDQKMDSLKGRFVISYVGRVQTYKGLDQIIRILPLLIKKNKNVLFVVAGEPRDIDPLIALSKQLGVGKYVLFLGKISEEEKRSLLTSTKIFVLPSKWEAFGISMLEAMAKGCAIITTRTEGGKYLIEEGLNGYLYDFNNLEQLETQFLKLLSNQKLLSKISKNNIQKAKQFTWQKISAELEELYKRLL